MVAVLNEFAIRLVHKVAKSVQTKCTRNQQNTGSSLVDSCYGQHRTLYTDEGRGSVLATCPIDGENTATDVVTARNIDASSSTRNVSFDISLTIIITTIYTFISCHKVENLEAVAAEVGSCHSLLCAILTLSKIRFVDLRTVSERLLVN